MKKRNTFEKKSQSDLQERKQSGRLPSLSSIMNRASVLLVLIMLAMTVLYSWSAVEAKKGYSLILDGYQSLEKVYSQTHQSRDALVTYLETGSEADREESFQYSEEVLSEIQKIRSNGTIYEPWRFELLERMAENLSQKREDVVVVYNPVGRALSNLDVYNEYIHSEELFQDSSSNYYRFLTQPMERMQEQITRLQNLAIGSGVFLCLGMLAIAIWYHMFNQCYIAKPHTQVLEGIDQIHQEDMNVSIDEMNSQEMERLRQSLLEMTAALRENYEMEKSNYELQKQLTQNEMKTMQEQINPHILFNTLYTIYCLAEEEHATDAAYMLLKTSRLLQYGLKNRNQLSTVAAEVQALQDYVEIQQIRFVGKIEFNIMADDFEEYGDQPFSAMIL